MAIQLITVHCVFYWPDGSPIDNATVTALMNKSDVAQDGYILTENAPTSTTDASGSCDLQLWPNSKSTRGNGTTYIIKLEKEGYISRIGPFSIPHENDQGQAITEINLHDLDVI